MVQCTFILYMHVYCTNTSKKMKVDFCLISLHYVVFLCNNKDTFLSFCIFVISHSYSCKCSKFWNNLTHIFMLCTKLQISCNLSWDLTFNSYYSIMIFSLYVQGTQSSSCATMQAWLYGLEVMSNTHQTTSIQLWRMTWSFILISIPLTLE